MSTPLKISVALCTFNGEAYLPQQLQSIIDQTRQPDELVVFDDGSTDGTIALLEQIAAKASFPVRIHRNSQTMGPAQNFGQAIADCTGDIISLCDQDDLWTGQKLAAAESVFLTDPGVAFVFSNASMCDAHGASLGYSLWDSVHFTKPLQQQFKDGRGFDVLLRQNVVTGATLSFAARYRPLLLPIGRGWMHDGWIALLLSAVCRGVAIDQQLIRYRQHAAQSVGALKRSFYQQYLNARAMPRDVFADQADAFEAAMGRLQEQNDFDVAGDVLPKLAKKIAHCRRRSAIRTGESSRIAAFGELFTRRYGRFSLGWKSFAQDLFL